MRTRAVLSISAATLLLFSSAIAADSYKIDPAHTRLAFSIRHLGISSVKGHFDDFTGSLVLEDNVIKEASATIQVKSINTGIQQRDNHLRTPDFFDATEYPVITLVTKGVEQVGGQTILIADFTMRGITRELRLPVTLSGPVQDPQGKTRVGLESKTKLNRKDYGIGFDAALGTGVALVGDEVSIEINAEAIKN